MPLVRLTFIPQDDHGCDVFVEDLRPCDVLIAPEDMPGGDAPPGSSSQRPRSVQCDEFEKRDALRAFGPEWWGNWPCCFEVEVEVLDPDKHAPAVL